MPGDDREVEEAEAALEEAREDLDSWLADTKLRGILRPRKKYVSRMVRSGVVSRGESR